MQQIKEKLPEGYFVTDTYYPSGNKKFVKPYTNTNVSRWSSDLLGIKHIQLVAANPNTWVNGYKSEITDKSDFRFQCGINDYKLSRKNFELTQEYREQGKDFFIYKVSEEK